MENRIILLNTSKYNTGSNSQNVIFYQVISDTCFDQIYVILKKYNILKRLNGIGGCCFEKCG